MCRPITQRLPGEKIADRLVSLAAPDARPIGKGKQRKHYEFGYVFQLTELTPNTRRGARGLVVPAASQIGALNESELLPTTVAELDRFGLKPREVAVDGGFRADVIMVAPRDPGPGPGVETLVRVSFVAPDLVARARSEPADVDVGSKQISASRIASRMARWYSPLMSIETARIESLRPPSSAKKSGAPSDSVVKVIAAARS